MTRGPSKSLDRAADLERLPQWAVTQIQNLQKRCERLEEQLAAGPEDSEAFLSGSHVHPDTPLGQHVTVYFGRRHKRGAGETMSLVSVQWDEDDKVLHVQANGGRLALHPGGGVNVIEVEVVTKF